MYVSLSSAFGALLFVVSAVAYAQMKYMLYSNGCFEGRAYAKGGQMCHVHRFVIVAYDRVGAVSKNALRAQCRSGIKHVANKAVCCACGHVDMNADMQVWLFVCIKTRHHNTVWV